MKMREPGFPHLCPVIGQKAMGTKKKSEHKKALFVLWKWSNTKRLQRSCGVSTLGDIEYLSGQTPGKRTLTLLEQKVAPDDLEIFFSIRMIL